LELDESARWLPGASERKIRPTHAAPGVFGENSGRDNPHLLQGALDKRSEPGRDQQLKCRAVASDTRIGGSVGAYGPRERDEKIGDWHNPTPGHLADWKTANAGRVARRALPQGCLSDFDLL